MFRTVLASAVRPLAVAGLVAALAAAPAIAPAQAEDDKVVARVDGVDITETDLALVGVEYAQDLMQIPEEARRKVLIDVMVDMHVLANAALKAGLADSDEFKKHLSYLKTRALRDHYFRKEVELQPDEAEVRARYDAEFGNYEGPVERRARHILVKTKEEAEALISELDGGKDFAELAKEKSTGPTGPNGGDLGFFAKGRMVPEFETAAFALDVGGYSKEPVETQFGWHVIKVEEERKQPAPAFEQVAEGLRTEIIRDRFQAVMEKLKADARIELLDPAATDDAAKQPDAGQPNAGEPDAGAK